MLFKSSEFIQLVATVLKIFLLMGIGVQVAPLMTWLERRQGALMQRRLGPNRVGIFKFRLWGLGQPLADAIKLLFKEDFIPQHANRIFYVLAPVIGSTLALLALMGIPFGTSVTAFGEKVSLQVASFDFGFLFLFAMSALGVYAVALAGWASNNKYSLLGALRSSAQMISYEISMGLSLLPLVIIYGTFNLQEIVRLQSEGVWGIVLAPVSFVIFLVTMFAETNRLPFDLAEGENELVAGFLVEYGSMRWSQFFLGEYTMMFTLSSLMVCLFLGGYELPFVPHDTLVGFLQRSLHLTLEPALWVAALVNLGVLLVKVAVLMLVYVQARFTLPRFRYDQLMRLGWQLLLPLALANLLVTTLVVAIVRFS